MKFPGRSFFFSLAMVPFAGVRSAEQAASAPVKTAPRIGSSVFNWEDLKVKPTPVGERRDVSDNPTPTFETFECHISTLNPGMASHPPHIHPQEELIILREGTLEVLLNGTSQKAGPGSLLFF